jgi:hypothetical protein
MLHHPSPIAVVATLSLVTSLALAWLLPCDWQPCLSIVALEAATAAWFWRARRADARQRRELGRSRHECLPIDRLIAAAPRGRLHLGVGVRWQRRHAQALFDLGRVDRDGIAQDLRTAGDNRILGVAWRDIVPIAINEIDANVHLLIYGASKRGKSLFAENLLVQVIAREQVPVIVIDPKGDAGMRARLRARARCAGVPFLCLDFADPAGSATYNPLSGCLDPDQVGDRIADLCDQGEGAGYWRGRAAGTARIVARAFDAVRLYLVACGGHASTPPPALAESERGRGYAELPIEFAPAGWQPRLSVLDLYGVYAAHRLLAWMLRVVYAHRFSGDPCEPGRIDPQQAQAWWDEVAAAPAHPCDADPVLQPLLSAVRIHLTRIHDLMDLDHDELAKANSSLFEALERFRGRVSLITDTAAPGIVWDHVAETSAVVYFSLAAQEYGELAMGFARILCADLVAWCGTRTRLGRDGAWYLLADEVDRWIPTCFIDFLARGRSAGLRCIAIGQTRASFATRLGHNGQQIIEGNVGTVVQFAAKGAEDAQAASRLSGSVRLMQQDLSIGTSAAGAAQYGLGDERQDAQHVSRTLSQRLVATEAVPGWAVQTLPTGTALIITQDGPCIISVPEVDHACG